MFPVGFFQDGNVIRPLMLSAVLSTFGVLGTSITASAGIGTSDFGTGNRCCSSGNEIFAFNSSGDMYRMGISSVQTKVLIKSSSRPVKLRSSGSTANGSHVYVVNGIQPVILGSTSNAFHRYSRVKDTWEVLANAPVSTSTSEIAIDTDSNDNIYYTSGTLFYRYNISTNTWSAISSSHGLNLGVHALVYHNSRIYLASSNVLKCYDIKSSVWSTLASLPLLSTAIRMFRYREYLYCFGGLTGILQYSIKDNKFSTVQGTLLGTGDMCAGVIGSSAYIFSGSTVYSFK